MIWKDALQQGQELVLATASVDAKPRAIVVVSLGLVDDKLLLGVCQMNVTLKNIKENKHVSIFAKLSDEYYRVDGVAELHSSGRYLDLAIERSSPPLPKQAVLIDIKEVFDLDKQKKQEL